MMFKFIPATLATLSFLSCVSAWDKLGHQTVASVAMRFISQTTLNSVSSILFDDKWKTTMNPTLVDVAYWAKDSDDMHYVDDDPPKSCGVNFQRELSGAGGCIITAIQNYTERVQDASLDATQRAEALKYLVNLFGEITQPLNGGRVDRLWCGVSLVFLDKVVWDLLVPLRLAGKYHSSMKVMTEKIVNEILSDKYPDSANWLCTDIKQAQTCATEWALDTNALACSYALNPYTAGLELNGPYYDTPAPVILMQIAKGAKVLILTGNPLHHEEPKS